MADVIGNSDSRGRARFQLGVISKDSRRSKQLSYSVENRNKCACRDGKGLGKDIPGQWGNMSRSVNTEIHEAGWWEGGGAKHRFQVDRLECGMVLHIFYFILSL